MRDIDSILLTLPESTGGTTPTPLDRGVQTGGWELFKDNIESLGGRMISPEELGNLKDSTFCCDEDAAQFCPSKKLVGPWDAEFGLTLGDWAVAETGTIVLNAKGHQRLASLAPPIHIAIIRKDCILASLEQVISRLSDRTSVFITGPSRTADIEGVLVRGVHGPKEIWVCMI